MGSHKDKKSKKDRKRSRSRSKDRDHKKKKRRQSSDSSSASDSDREKDVKFDVALEKERAQKKLQRKLEKERLKERETPEEKRARRLAKKMQKQEKRRKENDSYLPAQLAYTDLNNPFNDNKLTQVFVWGKKLEQQGKSNMTKSQIDKETRQRVEKNVREMEEMKRTRDARLAAKEDMDMIQRDMDRRAHGEWTSKEAQFQLEQAKVRSKLRISQNRAKPIDMLSRYIRSGDDPSEQDEKDKDDEDNFELDDPLSYMKGISTDDFEDLIEDIKVFRSLEGDRHAVFWQDIRTVVDDELKKHRDERTRDTIHGAVQGEVIKIFKGKSVDDLCKLERDIAIKVRTGGSGTDVSYWEGLQGQLKVYIAKTRLRELHQKMLQQRLRRIREEQMREVGKDEASSSNHHGHMEQEKKPKKEELDEMMEEENEDADPEELQKKLRKKIDLNELESPDLDEEQKENRWKLLAPDQLELATLELFERGGYSPTYGDVNDSMPGIEVLDEDADQKNLEERRNSNRKKPAGMSSTEVAMVAMARKGMEGDEATFAVEQPIEAQNLLWSDKYRPRKPTYLNRVQTGFDWNKYNQTHYDMDNPPPKIVQGYKFNIFYPDLLDPTETPSFTVTPCDDPDFAVIRFRAGPPYEDIAFKCVNREWEVNHKNGYKCQFQNGVFQLWFVFKRYRYRR